MEIFVRLAEQIHPLDSRSALGQTLCKLLHLSKMEINLNRRRESIFEAPSPFSLPPKWKLIFFLWLEWGSLWICGVNWRIAGRKNCVVGEYCGVILMTIISWGKIVYNCARTENDYISKSRIRFPEFQYPEFQFLELQFPERTQFPE